MDDQPKLSEDGSIGMSGPITLVELTSDNLLDPDVNNKDTSLFMFYLYHPLLTVISFIYIIP